MSQAPAEPRQTVPLALKLSFGQFKPVPLQFSALSHPPLAARQTVVVARGEQVPSLPGSAHEAHAPLHGPVQHTPWLQYALPSGAFWHSDAALHLAPGGFGPQDPFTQNLPAMHCESWVHVVKQTAPLHTYGLQVELAGVMHLPASLQVAASV